jgi:uncharacterized membrane protein YoaK (UPF0700 family)
MLVLKTLLLAAGAAIAVRFGPFSDGDSGLAMLTGMTLVSAMAIQNAAHRIHLASAPPTTLMTGTTTQVMIDLADLLRGLPPEDAVTARARLLRMSGSVAMFAAGCAAAALSFSWVNIWCLVIPPVLAACAVALQHHTREGEAKALVDVAH